MQWNLAARKVKAGEELYLDYGEGYWAEKDSDSERGADSSSEDSGSDHEHAGAESSPAKARKRSGGKKAVLSEEEDGDGDTEMGWNSDDSMDLLSVRLKNEIGDDGWI